MNAQHTLTSGRKVIEYAETNGSTFVEIEGGAEMTDEEWTEYCAHLRALDLAQSRARLAKRKAIMDKLDGLLNGIR